MEGAGKPRSIYAAGSAGREGCGGRDAPIVRELQWVPLGGYGERYGGEKKKTAPFWAPLSTSGLGSGGGGENRTRVRKPSTAQDYMLSLVVWVSPRARRPAG